MKKVLFFIFAVFPTLVNANQDYFDWVIYEGRLARVVPDGTLCYVDRKNKKYIISLKRHNSGDNIDIKAVYNTPWQKPTSKFNSTEDLDIFDITSACGVPPKYMVDKLKNSSGT